MQAWSRWTIGDKEVLKAVQRRAVGIVTKLNGKTYQEKLAELGMVTLEERRRRGDLVQMFKTVTGKDKVNSAWRFQPA